MDKGTQAKGEKCEDGACKGLDLPFPLSLQRQPALLAFDLGFVTFLTDTDE